MGMLLTESEKSQEKSVALSWIFVITTINEKTGGGTKYINRRDVNYLPAAITERKLSEKSYFCHQSICGWASYIQIFSDYRFYL